MYADAVGHQAVKLCCKACARCSYLYPQQEEEVEEYVLLELYGLTWAENILFGIFGTPKSLFVCLLDVLICLDNAAATTTASTILASLGSK